MPDLGKINFSVKYENNKLDVKIIQCQALMDKDAIGKSDPFVRLYILPGKHTELKTKTMNNNLNPVFNMSFSFTLTPTQMYSKTAIFQVFDSDFGKDGKLGEARFPFSNANVKAGTEVNYWMDLSAFTEVPPTVSRRISVSSTVVDKDVTVVSPQLRDLNHRLENIVSKNYQYADVDAKLIINLLSKKMNDNVSSQAVLSKLDHHFQPLREDYNTLALIQAKIALLQKENYMVQVRTDHVEGRIAAKKMEEERLQRAFHDLEFKYKQLQTETNNLNLKHQALQVDWVEMKKQCESVLEQFRMEKLNMLKLEGELHLVTEKAGLCTKQREGLWSAYTSSFNSEIECPSVYWEVIQDYANKIEEEVRNLRDMYTNYNNEIIALHDNEISRLTKLSMSDQGQTDDISGVLAELETVKTEMLDLEMRKLSFRQKIFEVKFAMDKEEALFLAQLNAKEGALEFLQGQYGYMKKKLVRSMSRVKGLDTKQYSSIIKDAECHANRNSRVYESMDGREITGLSLTPMNNNDGEVVGWNIEEHFRESNIQY